MTHGTSSFANTQIARSNSGPEDSQNFKVVMSVNDISS